MVFGWVFSDGDGFTRGWFLVGMAVDGRVSGCRWCFIRMISSWVGFRLECCLVGTFLVRDGFCRGWRRSDLVAKNVIFKFVSGGKGVGLDSGRIVSVPGLNIICGHTGWIAPMMRFISFWSKGAVTTRESPTTKTKCYHRSKNHGIHVPTLQTRRNNVLCSS